jgi:hypothetical protein
MGAAKEEPKSTSTPSTDSKQTTEEAQGVQGMNVKLDRSLSK